MSETYMERLLEAHRRFHGKVGCPGGKDCYVCALEMERQLLECGDPLSGGDYQQMQDVRSAIDREKRTPGPWYRIQGQGVVDRVSAKPEGKAPWIAEVCGGLGDGVTEANAQLIAAAPELLEALEFALQQTGCDGDLCTERWHEEARRAIAKARGERE